MPPTIKISKFMGGNTVYTTCLVIILPLNFHVWDYPTIRPSFGGLPGGTSFGFDRGRQCILARLHGGASGFCEILSRVAAMNLHITGGQWTWIFVGMIFLNCNFIPTTFVCPTSLFSRFGHREICLRVSLLRLSCFTWPGIEVEVEGCDVHVCL